MNTYLPPKKVIDQMKNIKPKGIILHHTAGNSESTPEDINHWFVVGRQVEGYLWIGYHAIIYKDGTVVQTRPWTKNGGHCPGYNTTHIGISFVGNYENEPPTAEMWTAYKDLVTSLKVQYPEIQDITNHRDANARIGGAYTLCPGKYLYELSTSAVTTQPQKTETNNPQLLVYYSTTELLTELMKRYADK
jgi:hypothetical protein